MATLTLHVPPAVAEKLASPVLHADCVALDSVLEWSVQEVHAALWALSEEEGEIDRDRMRALVDELDGLAKAQRTAREN